MSFSTDWDIEKYYDETLPESHWEMRKEFMETNKTLYPEEYLVAMAQVLYNAEFLGCTYNSDVMKRVYEMGADVIKKHRAKRKTKLQRTFVSAKDAAENKAQRKDPSTFVRNVRSKQ